MNSLNQDSNRDFVVVAGRIQTVSDIDSAVIIIDNTVRSQLGEYRYNVSKGIDYEWNVFGTNPNFQLFDAQIRRNVLSLSFVKNITEFKYSADNGELSYNMTVSTIFGDAIINEL